MCSMSETNCFCMITARSSVQLEWLCCTNILEFEKFWYVFLRNVRYRCLKVLSFGLGTELRVTIK